ncbi:hypothetical protein C8J28_13912 [Cereibacter azotoformans]|uniref:Uncharacterized protein n=1 Tax=Cereibacter azotoformans TaxID=43057 RepID=A0A2T5JLK0_9RHOB|nr:hypothetical protein C8J28_13912 [Cereibacter azotoformans]
MDYYTGLARKIAVLMHSLWKNGSTYDFGKEARPA